MAGAVTLYVATSASALDPNRMVSQYLHYSWGIEEGFPNATVSAIAQSRDGYLWIGTDKGLFRFDGLNFRQFAQATPSSLTIGPVQTLLTDGQGDLWILLRSTQLLRYRDGTFEISRGIAENGITAVGRGLGNAILMSSLAMGTFVYDGQQFTNLSSEPTTFPATAAATPDERSTRLSWSVGLVPNRLAVPNTAVTSLAETEGGSVWLGTRDRGLFYFSDGHLSAAGALLADSRINCLLPLDKRELWIGTPKGIVRWTGVALTNSGVPSSLVHAEVLSMLRDLEGNIWVGTSRGLLRFNTNGVSSFIGATPKAEAAVTALFEDREGNIWTGGSRGIERLRDTAFATYTVQGLKSQSMGPLYVDAQDHIWFGPIEGGLHSLQGGEGGAVTAAGLNHDSVYSITGNRKDELWVGRQRGGLTQLRNIHGSITSGHQSRDGPLG